ncbi:TetR/AcrR family transcriptional regulator [Paenibacillus sp. sptzw28]|uniref:TetR/AcrR family transcriptional regulator n=1 Tax=Paenibacillus sp. sptzw28 TaxID=715179 RepID=UPI001C6EA689|nr:TetR/AcrR family transcriptional regulator [Paenibacillus sp. sptzw28]QYR22387.1 TetR/AcrR family transcriptional regulator [Paenibacillus sp. sptzw28]
MTVDRRALILKAAAQSFAQFGYKATTMDLVSKIANVGKGTIYTFFKTKDELFEEILRKVLQEMRQVMDGGIVIGDTFIHNIFRVLDSLLEFRSDHELFIKLSQEVRDIGTVQAVEGIRQLESMAREFLKQQIDQAIRDGEIKPCDSNIVAFMFLRLYVGLTTEWNKSAAPLSKEQIKDNIRLLISEGLLITK